MELRKDTRASGPGKALTCGKKQELGQGPEVGQLPGPRPLWRVRAVGTWRIVSGVSLPAEHHVINWVCRARGRALVVGVSSWVLPRRVRFHAQALHTYRRSCEEAGGNHAWRLTLSISILLGQDRALGLEPLQAVRALRTRQ